MKKTYLVTGGQGFIGKAVSFSLLDQGYNVITFDNNFREKKFLLTHQTLKVIQVQRFIKMLQLIQLTKKLD